MATELGLRQLAERDAVEQVERRVPVGAAGRVPTSRSPAGPGRPAGTRSPASARQAARLTAVVVLPTPPFWFATATIRALTLPLSRRGRTPPARRTALRRAVASLRRRRDGEPLRASGRSCGGRGTRQGPPRGRLPGGPRRGRLAAASAEGPTQRIAAPPRRDEREQPFGGGRRVGQSLRDGDAVHVGGLLLGPTPHDREVGKGGGPALEEQGLATLGLEEGHVEGSEARRRAGCPACHRPSRRRRAGRARRRRARRRGGRRRAAPAVRARHRGAR